MIKISQLKSKPEYYNNYLVIGWREWLTLPDLGIARVKAKIDTGARTSALHASEITEFKKRGKTFVRFIVHPLQRDNHYTVHCEAELVEWRKVKNSGGKVTQRPVVLTKIEVGEWSWNIELTLVNRDQMGFRMLLGREAVRGHLLVNPGGSYLLGNKQKRKKK